MKDEYEIIIRKKKVNQVDLFWKNFPSFKGHIFMYFAATINGHVGVPAINVSDINEKCIDKQVIIDLIKQATDDLEGLSCKRTSMYLCIVEDIIDKLKIMVNGE